MENLHELLKIAGYKKIGFKIARTHHLFIRAKINGVWGDFILDSGASNSCVDFQHIDTFQLTAKASETKASGAGGNGLLTKLSYDNQLQLGRWKKEGINLILLDLTHVNTALTEYKTKNVHGIIGSDILIQGEAIIDYKGNKFYLK